MEEAKNFLAPRPLLHPANIERYLSERYQYLCTFPEEIWVMILDNITDPKELEHVANKSLYFRNLVHHRLTEMLFPSVFGIMAKLNLKRRGAAYKKDGNTNSENIQNDFRNEIIFPQDWNGSGILKLRLVCKTWNSAIDNFLNPDLNSFIDVDKAKGEFHLRTFPHFWEHYNLPFNIIVRGQNVENVFRQHFATSHEKDERSPFISKSIRIRLMFDRYQLLESVFLKQLLLTLSIYGKHVKYCKIVGNRDRRLTLKYFILKLVLSKMPNLEYLEISFKKRFEASPIDGEELSQCINLNPLPKLSKLETLAVVCKDPMDNVLLPIFNELARSNKEHLKSLRLSKNGRDFQNFNCRQSSNPTERQLGILPLTQLSYFFFSRPNWCFTNVDLFTFGKNLHLKEYFTMIQSICGNTLTDLFVVLPDPIYKDMGHVPSGIRFKNLNKFQLTTQSYVSFNHMYLINDSLQCLDGIAPFSEEITRNDQLARVTNKHQNAFETHSIL